MINIKRFDKAKAHGSHENTILADNVLPDGMKAPFHHQYGYLENRHTMLGHKHPTDEIYHVVSGSGLVVVGDENRDVRAGDVIDIPANTWHTMSCADEGPLLWACYWWEVIGEGRAVPEHISVKRFDTRSAYDAHEGTILADKVCPPGMTAPFSHQYGYLEPGKSMAGHAHPTEECYIVTEGKGFVTVGEEKAEISAGDVVEIPVDVWHTMTAAPDCALTWFAFWWDPKDDLDTQNG